MIKQILSLLFSFLVHAALSAQPLLRHTVSGYVREAGSGESLPGVSVALAGKAVGTITNAYGFYSLTLPAANSLTLAITSVGYHREMRTVAFNQSLVLNIDLLPESTVLGAVEVHAAPQKVSQTARMSVASVPITQIKQIPALLAEKDVLKVLQLLPGVQKGNEGNSGLYVRGGGPDQNLIILDDATVYNAFHLFGFLSLFNGDALKSVELTKGGFPARYGGRLSSVVEMQMKDGRRDKFGGEGGIGLLSSRLTLEGPIKSKKSDQRRASYLISGRRTYLDLITRLVAKAGYGFTDLNGKVNYDLNDRNRLYLSGYFGHDGFAASNNQSKGAFNWGNTTATLRWNHQFSNRLFANASLIYSNYRFQVSQEDAQDKSVYSLAYSSGIRDFSLKYDVDFLPTPAHAIRAGLLATAHRFTPSALVLKDAQLDTVGRRMTAIDAVEWALYAEDTYQPWPRLRINAGVRLSQFATGGISTPNPGCWRLTPCPTTGP